MECPHCHSEITATPHVFALGEDQDGSWQVANTRCEVCDRLIVSVCTKDGHTYPAWPPSSLRPRLSADVPPEYADDYHTAAKVYAFSPEAAGALSRRLLQQVLLTKTTVGEGSLADQIRRAVLGTELPHYLKEALQTYAGLAKLDMNPGKSSHPAELVPVEPGEVEWLLDVLQAMFDLYFVQPARLQRKKQSLEQELVPPPPPEPAEASSVPQSPPPPVAEPEPEISSPPASTDASTPAEG